MERINGYWLQEAAIQMESQGGEKRKILTDAMPNLSKDVIDKLLGKQALLKELM